MRQSKKIKYFQSSLICSFFLLFNLIWLFFSHLYLCLTNTPIIDVGATSYNNYVFLTDLASLSIFIFSWIIFYYSEKPIYKPITSNTQNQRQTTKTDSTILFCTTILLLILMLNIYLDGSPPILSQGYINRASYLDQTPLWIALKPFGAVAIIFPICTGYLLNKALVNNRSTKTINTLFIFYLIYLITIGQKFSGLFLGIYFHALPLMINKTTSHTVKLSARFIITILITGSLGIFLLGYHYEKNPLAYEITSGPYEFLLYRLFALQGGLSWSYFNITDGLNWRPDFLWGSMQKMMLASADPTIATDMINRGVNMTGAFPANILFSFPLFISPFILTFIFIVFLKYSHHLARLHATIYYIPLAYILVNWVTFFSRGGLEEILNIKTLFAVAVIGAIKIGLAISKKRSSFKKASF